MCLYRKHDNGEDKKDEKCHRNEEYIRDKILGSWANKFGRTSNLQNQDLFTETFSKLVLYDSKLQFDSYQHLFQRYPF